mgnify:CR=1 FL=1
MAIATTAIRSFFMILFAQVLAKFLVGFWTLEQGAAELIKEEFGDFARISFSSEVIVKDVTRGFIIKVYR